MWTPAVFSENPCKILLVAYLIGPPGWIIGIESSFWVSVNLDMFVIVTDLIELYPVCTDTGEKLAKIHNQLPLYCSEVINSVDIWNIYKPY